MEKESQFQLLSSSVMGKLFPTKTCSIGDITSHFTCFLKIPNFFILPNISGFLCSLTLSSQRGSPNHHSLPSLGQQHHFLKTFMNLVFGLYRL
jgi:hypothetical protein